MKSNPTNFRLRLSSRWILLAALSPSVLLAAPSWAQTSVGSATVADADAPSLASLSKEMICPCPSCGGKALDQCEPQCHDGQVRRDSIAAQLRLGKSHDQIVKFMSATYGAQILGAPPSEGFGILAVAMPLACLAAGALPLAMFTRARGASARGAKNGKRAAGRATPASAPTASEDARVAAALKDFDF